MLLFMLLLVNVTIYVIVGWCSCFLSLTAAVLKSYLRELPEPLMTFELYSEWMHIMELLVFFCLCFPHVPFFPRVWGGGPIFKLGDEIVGLRCLDVVSSQ